MNSFEKLVFDGLLLLTMARIYAMQRSERDPDLGAVDKAARMVLPAHEYERMRTVQLQYPHNAIAAANVRKLEESCTVFAETQRKLAEENLQQKLEALSVQE